MMDMFVELVGWAGAAAVLGAYGLLSSRRLSSDSYTYHGLNMAGAVLLAFYALWKSAWASVAVNVVWLLIGVCATWALHRFKKTML